MEGRPGKGRDYDRGLPQNAVYTSKLFGLICVGSMAEFYTYSEADGVGSLIRVVRIRDYTSQTSEESALNWWSRVYSMVTKYVGANPSSPPPS